MMDNIKLFESESNISLIVKTAGNACNINCRYCFETPKHVAKNIVTTEQLDAVISSINGTCSVVFHGGEPLIIGIPAFTELLDCLKKYYPHKVVAVRIQTNGTLLNKEWINLIYNVYKGLNIEIAISLDGTEEMNQFRIYHSGMNIFSKVRNAYVLLENEGKKAGMLSVISKPSLEFYNEYVDLINSIPNLSFVKINGLFNVENNQLTVDSITPTEYIKFVCNVGKKYIEDRLYTKIAIEPILSVLQRIYGKQSKYCNYSCRKCFNYICVYPDGKIAPCDCFSVNDFQICNIGQLSNEGDLNYYIAKYISDGRACDFEELIKECANCDIKDFCSGGCLSQRYYFRDNIRLSADFCEARHYIYNYFMGLVKR